MMKKITLLLALLITSIGFSQTYDLITNGDFANDADSWSGSAFTIVDGEAFFSETAAAGNPWDTQLTQANLEFEDAKEYVLTFYARAAASRKITVAIQNVGIWNDQFRQDFDLTTAMTMFTATFNATSSNASVQIGFLMAGIGNTEAVYFDDISLVAEGTAAETCNDGILNNGETAIDCGGPNCDACPSPPITLAPMPPARNTGDVVSIFSDAYSDLASNFDAGWCGNDSVEMIQIEGNDIVAFKGNNCQGIVLPAGIDITSYTNMHVDVYIDESVDVASKVFNLKFVQQPGGAALEVNFNAASSPALVAGSWISIDVQVDLAIFTGFKEFGITADNLKNQVWYDNLYIYRAATASVSDNELLNVSMYPNPASDVLNISAANTIKNASIFNVLGKKVMSLDINKNSESIDVSSLASGIYLIKYELDNATGTAKFIKE